MNYTHTLGFLFDPTYEHVALIRKNRPAWAFGLLNGIGGKVDSLDMGIADTMYREFKEETGVEVTDWKQFGILTSPEHDFRIGLFAAAHPDVYNVQSVTDEEVCLQEVRHVLCALPHYYCENTQWMVAMARNMLFGQKTFFGFEIKGLTKPIVE
jgi:8-oxo-dGTP diphosphatase